ncbi:MAG: phosphatidylinositol-specific phospholipase C [Clostridia bacterium]|nr:phosphatidylinositol-specific phospholipase C [Clostridia bacterium]
MNKIISSIVAFVTLVLAVFGIGRVDYTGEFQQRSWMASISDEALISEISIPGTHDSCALYEPIHPSAKCQNYTIKDQLEMGVRFLDIRGVALIKKIGMVHGPIYQARKLDYILDECYSFLKENPTETIIMSVKEDLSIGDSIGRFISLVDKYISANSDMWFTENRLPTLGEVRGKIVLFNRYDGSSGFGLSTAPFRDNCSFSSPQPAYTLNVQDFYHIEKVEDKWALAEELFENCYNCQDRENNLFINFMSGYMGTIPDIVTVADGMIKNFSDYMAKAPKGCYGIVLFDFASPELCNSLIAKNF